MASFGSMTLSKRIGVIVLAGLAIGLGLFSWLGIEALNRSTERILNERLIISRMAATYLDEAINYMVIQSKKAADFGSRFPSSDEFSLAADSLHQVFSRTDVSLGYVLLIDRSGIVVQSEPENPDIIGAQLAEYPDVINSLENGLPAVSGLVSNPTIKTPVELITTPILDPAGNSIGAIVCTIDIQQSDIGVFNQMEKVGKTAYLEIVDENGIVIARTKPGSSPTIVEKSDHPDRFAELIRRGEATVGTCHRCHETNQTFQKKADVLAFAPLSHVSWGIAIRQAQEEALAPTSQLERQLLLLGLIVLVGTLLLVWGMMQGIVKPIKTLTTAAMRIATGDYKTPIPIRGGDEIGQLSDAFSSMTEELTRSRDELLSRNEELTALNSISATVSQSLDLNELLEKALQKVLEVTKAPAGTIFLVDSRGNRLTSSSALGSSAISSCTKAGSPESDCACHRVVVSGQTMVVNHVSQCNLLPETLSETGELNCFACVPLKYKDRCLGVMNIVFSEEGSLTDRYFRLLDSIGFHIGLALENSGLYEDLKQKEELRGKLLNGIITAQEEERKRIAREIHDEYGQTLAGLMMSIESCEGMVLPAQQELRDKIQHSKSTVSEALEAMRRLALDLRPLALDDLGLSSAIRTYARRSLDRVGVNVKFEIEGLHRRFESATETAVFRIVQESIHNISRHAQARNVNIKLKVENKILTAVIEDDGQGFDLDSLQSRAGVKSLGLLGIKERTSILGGSFAIETRKGQGTKLQVEIPIDNHTNS